MKMIIAPAILLMFGLQCFAEDKKEAPAEAKPAVEAAKPAVEAAKPAVEAVKPEVKKPKDASWFETTLKGLRSKVDSRYESRGARVTAVAAVRGDDMNKDAKSPAWKGGVAGKADKKLAKDKKELAAAIELVLNGKQEEGKASLEKFIKENPESSLLPDAKEALAKLSEAPAEPPAESKEPAK